MLKHLHNALDSLEARSIREKVLIGGAISAVLVMMLQVLLIDPLVTRQDGLRGKLRTAADLKRSFEGQLKNSPYLKILDRQRALEAEIEIVERQLQQLDTEVAEYASSLISPEEMPELLETLLAEQSLQLINVNNITAIPVLNRNDSDQSQETSLNETLQLYRHGITISLRGEYPAIVGYLKRLESQPWKLIWHSMNYEVAEYPLGQVELHLQTLSTDKRWLGV